ncbi:MAG: hypothetical protein KJO81_05350 [Gammaproteobacteria bacterium]|nr:hypothetical protein [Gammaproteobacteria bacterium]
MLEPVKPANAVKSIESRLVSLVEELAVVRKQTSEVKHSIANFTKDIYFTKNTLEETKYSVEVIKFEIRELTGTIDAIQANLKSILWIIRVISIAALVGVAILADSYFNWIEQFMVFSGKFF